MEDRYATFRDALTESAHQVLPKVKNTAKQRWITTPILPKMDPRRLAQKRRTIQITGHRDKSGMYSTIPDQGRLIGTLN